MIYDDWQHKYMFLNMLAIFFLRAIVESKTLNFSYLLHVFVDDSIEILCVLSKNTFVHRIHTESQVENNSTILYHISLSNEN